MPPFSFALKAGEILLIQGKNGRGKSSLLRLLAGLLPKAEGLFFWQEQEIVPEHPHHRQKIAYLGHKVALEPSGTVLEELSKTSAPDGMCFEKLQVFGLASLQHTPIHFLSQGQQQRVALCRISLSQRPLWLLDEPTSHLDSQAQETLYQEILAHTQVGGVVVLTSHDRIPLQASQVLQL